MADLEYWYFPTSHWSRTLSLVLAEKGLDPVRHVVEIRKNASFEPDYVRINPRGVVPTISVDGEIVWDSPRIARRLDELAGPRLVRDDDERAARWAERMEAFPTMLFSYSVWVRGERGERSRDILADKVARGFEYAERHPDLAELYLRKARFFEAFRAQVYDADHVQRTIDAHRPVLEEMGAAADERGFLAGDELTFADLIATSLLYRLVDLRLLDEWSRDPEHPLTRYYERMKARPSFAAVFVDDPLIPR